MNSHTLSDGNNQNSINYTKKGDENVPNVSETEDSRLQDGVEIDAILYSSTIHQYANMECNNESHPPLMNGKMSPLKNHQFQH